MTISGPVLGDQLSGDPNLVGDKEQIFDPRRALANATRLVPEVQAELLAGAGHLLAMDSAQQVNQRMLQFLSS